MKESEALLEATPVSTCAMAPTMKALVYHGPGRRPGRTKPRPALQEPTDAVVRITTSTICGTDLHILKGDVPDRHRRAHPRPRGRRRRRGGGGRGVELPQGRQGPHLVHHVLRQVRLLQEGHVLALPRRRLDPGPHHRRHAGRVRADSRTPTRASTRSRRTPTRRRIVMLSDILPTGFECGVLNGQVKPGDTVAIVGRGPHRPRRAPHRAVLFAGRDHHGRPGRQPPRGGARLRRHAGSSTAPTGRRSRR